MRQVTKNLQPCRITVADKNVHSFNQYPEIPIMSIILSTEFIAINKEIKTSKLPALCEAFNLLG